MTDKAYNRRGQSIFEYFILTIIVVSIALYFTTKENFTDVQYAVEEGFNQSVASIVAPGVGSGGGSPGGFGGAGGFPGGGAGGR